MVIRHGARNFHRQGLGAVIAAGNSPGKGQGIGVRKRFRDRNRVDQCLQRHTLGRRQRLIGHVGGQIVHDVRHIDLAGGDSRDKITVGFDVRHDLAQLIQRGVVAVR